MGDVPITFADIFKAEQLLNYMPRTNFKKDVINLKNWLEMK
jgi:hypothetical protein